MSASAPETAPLVGTGPDGQGGARFSPPMERHASHGRSRFKYQRIIPVPIVLLATILPTVYIWLTPILAELETKEGHHFRFFAIRPDVQVTYSWPDSSLDANRFVGGSAAKAACKELEASEKNLPWHKRHHVILRDVLPYDCPSAEQEGEEGLAHLRGDEIEVVMDQKCHKKWMCGFKELHETKAVRDTMQVSGKTLSNYVSISSATGMMACLFFFPAMFFWVSYGDMVRRADYGYTRAGAENTDVAAETDVVPRTSAEDDILITGTLGCSGYTIQWLVFITLLLFQLSWGLFLGLPVLEYPVPHVVAVGLFMFFMICHMVLRFIDNFNWVVCVICFVPAVLGFVLIVLFNTVLQVNMRDRTDIFQYGFWLVEVAALSASMWFAPLYLVTRNCDCGCGCCCRWWEGGGDSGQREASVGEPIAVDKEV